MLDRHAKRLPTLATNSSRTYAQRWLARMTPEEAMKGVIRMMSAYSEFSPCNPEYMMSLADALCQFPMEVATAACSPVHGVPKSQKNFRPNVGQLTEWCTREAAFLYRMAEREGLLRSDSHKTYSGIIRSFNSHNNPNETNSVGFMTQPGCELPKTTPEQRVAHVERRRSQGRLTFDRSPEAERRKPWFDRLTTEEAERTLARYAAEAAPSVPSPTLGGDFSDAAELQPVAF
jgi:hypothetical protein